MVRWTQGRLPIIAGLALAGGGAAWTWWAYRLAPEERGDALAFPGFVLGLVGVLVGVVPLLARLGGRPVTRPVDELAAGLAQAVGGQWRKAAHERRLLPDPIPVRWSLSELTGRGSVAAAVGTADQPPTFPPLPDQAQITEANLWSGGGRTELYAGYAGLASGRIIVVGAPGAGKSGAAVLLLLDALAHRDTLDETQRARVPVPVLLTSHGWDPHTTPVPDWLADHLAVTYPMFAHRRGRAEAAELVAARDRIALILDGLDEMDEGLRPAALQALSDAPFRIVVLTRSKELADAASQAWLFGAVAVRLHDVTTPDAAAYLERARTGPPPSGWPELLAHLRTHSDGVLARGLSTPLTLTLLRDTYQPGDDVRELLNHIHYPTPDTIEQHLIARVLPTAYAPRPGRPAPRYTEQQARQALTFIAQKLGTSRDLAWWHIPTWAPARTRILATGLAFGLAFGLVGALLGGFTLGFAFGLTLGLMGERRYGKPRRVSLMNWRAVLSGRVLRLSLTFGLVVGLAGGLMGGLTGGLAGGLAGGLTGVLAGGLAFGLLGVFIEGDTREGSPLGPSEVWRNDQIAGLTIGLTFGLTSALVIGLAVGLALELVSGLTFWLTCGLVIGLAFGLVGTEAWWTRLAWIQVWRSGGVPAVRLIPFLEDAREHGVLRTVGAVYQFRHATLQDQLAGQATPATQVSPAVPGASQTP